MRPLLTGMKIISRLCLHRYTCATNAHRQLLSHGASFWNDPCQQLAPAVDISYSPCTYIASSSLVFALFAPFSSSFCHNRCVQQWPFDWQWKVENYAMRKRFWVCAEQRLWKIRLGRENEILLNGAQNESVFIKYWAGSKNALSLDVLWNPASEQLCT